METLLSNKVQYGFEARVCSLTKRNGNEFTQEDAQFFAEKFAA